VVVGVPALRVGVGQPAQEIGQLTVALGPKGEMPVVRHDTIRQHADGMSLQRHLEHAFESVVVAVFLKKRQARDGPIEAMVHIAARSGPRMAWHGDSVRKQ